MSGLGAPPGAPPIVLASASRVRADMLARAGVDVRIAPASIDEDEVRRGLKAEGASPEAAAETLAELKAMRVARLNVGALVIGADQMLACDGTWFDKPADRAAARAQLAALRGRTHELYSAVCVVQDAARLWHHVGRARMTMRNVDDAFLEAYLDAAGADALASVGCYRLEGLGVSMFARIEGDFFDILGLPLLPLLDFLRVRGAVR